jgi:methylated-DNA-[protein]-cysteine S-methyltransferase
VELFLSKIDSPLGEMLLVTDDQGAIHALDFADHRQRLMRGLQARHGAATIVERDAPAAIASAIGRYFSGELEALVGLPVVLDGSALEKRVWAALREIPSGTTVSYGKLAKTLGFTDPRAAIDVGAANKVNPVAIIVPCHRVIASDGGLKGYAWGLHRKRWLLEHEKAIPQETPTPSTHDLPGL